MGGSGGALLARREDGGRCDSQEGCGWLRGNPGVRGRRYTGRAEGLLGPQEFAARQAGG